MPATESRFEMYRLLSRGDLDARFSFPGPASLAAVYLSPIVLLAHFEIDLPALAKMPGDARRSQGVDLRKQLRMVMRLLLMRLREHGVDCPAVALLSPGSENAARIEGAGDAFRAAYVSLQSEQDWHRGEFLVFVEGSHEKATERLEDLLAPEPPRPTLAASAQSLPEVIGACRAYAEKNALFSELLRAWERGLAECEKRNLLPEERDRRCAEAGLHAIEDHVSRYLAAASRLLAEVE